LTSKNFKNLQAFKIYFTDSIIYKGILQSASNLKFLELGMVECIVESSIVAVKNLEHLKVLNMSKDWAIKFFASDVSDIKFKLKEFEITLPRENNEIDTENFVKFIENQTELEKLNMIEWFNFKVLDAIFHSKIKEFSLWDVPESGWKSNFVSVSKSIETLDIKLVYVEPHANNIREFLSRVPNVKNLKLRNINEEIATFIASTMPNIQRISTIHGDISEDICRIFPQQVEFN
jgi:hypothetical protein